MFIFRNKLYNKKKEAKWHTSKHIDTLYKNKNNLFNFFY